MSERAIAIEDLVRVALPRLCCGSTETIGYVFTVTEFGTTDECGICGAKYPPRRAAFGEGMDGLGIVVERLRRIPPLPELEGAQHTTELEIAGYARRAA